jgi:hypothetical protein
VQVAAKRPLPAARVILDGDDQLLTSSARVIAAIRSQDYP